MKALRHHRAGNTHSWRFDRRPQDASLRYQVHGPIQPMASDRSFLARLFGGR